MDSFFGIHTAVPGLLSKAADGSSPAAAEIVQKTPLKATKKLPPFVVLVGDRRRVDFVCEFLENACVLTDEMASKGLNRGRCQVAVGLFKGTPVVVCETQMGGPATEIIVRELLSSQVMGQQFEYEGRLLKADAKYVIRVGSCAGLNDPDNKETRPIECLHFECNAPSWCRRMRHSIADRACQLV